MSTIDINVSTDLEKDLKLPSCDDLKLPLPSPLKITLPTGTSLQAFTDISKGIPTDCAMSFNLLIQVAPFLASIECLIKVLAVIGPLVGVVQGDLTPDTADKLAKAMSALAPCLKIAIPGLPWITFVRDILCLILKVLRCILGQLKSIAGLIGGLAIQLESAKQSGNSDLQKAIECAQENAAISAKHLSESMESIGALLKLLEPFMSLANAPVITLPPIGSATDLQSLNQTIQAIQGVVDSIEAVTDSLGGCPA